MVIERRDELLKRLKLTIDRIEEIALEDETSVVSLGILPCVQTAKTEISRIENEINLWLRGGET